jgi:hypothetical protein
MRKLWLLFVWVIFLPGCNLILGIGNYKPLMKSEIEKCAKRYKIPLTELAEIDTTLYTSFLTNIRDDKLKKNLKQPLQVRVFDSKGKINLFIVNCTVGGFPKLGWNRCGSFDVFPPDKKCFSNVDTTLSMNADLKYYLNTNGSKINPETFEKQDVTIVIYWAKFMARHSKRLIRLINDYKDKHKDKKIAVLYVNDDNLYK